MDKLLELAERVEKASADEQADMIRLAWEAVYGDREAYKDMAADRKSQHLNALGQRVRMFDAGAFLDAAMTLVPEGWRVSALEQDWKTSLWKAQLGPKPSPAMIAAYIAGRTVGWETADAPEDGRAAIATPALALTAACLRARSALNDGGSNG